MSVVGPDKYCTAPPQALTVLFGLACTQKAVEYFLGFILIDHFGHHYRAVRTGAVNAYLKPTMLTPFGPMPPKPAPLQRGNRSMSRKGFARVFVCLWSLPGSRNYG